MNHIELLGGQHQAAPGPDGELGSNGHQGGMSGAGVLR